MQHALARQPARAYLEVFGSQESRRLATKARRQRVQPWYPCPKVGTTAVDEVIDGGRPPVVFPSSFTSGSGKPSAPPTATY
jgi:hypothetical protein